MLYLDLEKREFKKKKKMKCSEFITLSIKKKKLTKSVF
jgi:hypothetical protein